MKSYGGKRFRFRPNNLCLKVRTFPYFTWELRLLSDKTAPRYSNLTKKKLRVSKTTQSSQSLAKNATKKVSNPNYKTLDTVMESTLVQWRV